MANQDSALALGNGTSTEVLLPRGSTAEIHRKAVAHIAIAIAKEMRLSSREIASLTAAALHQDAEKPEISRIANLRQWPWRHGEGLSDENGNVPPTVHLLYFANSLEAAIDLNATTDEQKDKLFSCVTNRIGSHFHPEVYAAFARAARGGTFWQELSDILQETTLD